MMPHDRLLIATLLNKQGIIQQLANGHPCDLLEDDLEKTGIVPDEEVKNVYNQQTADS